MRGSHSVVAVCGHLIGVASIVQHGLQSTGFGSCSTCPEGNVESSQTRDQTTVPYISRWSLNHWTIREVPGTAFDTGVLALIEQNKSFFFFCLVSDPCLVSGGCQKFFFVIYCWRKSTRGCDHWLTQELLFSCWCCCCCCC